MEIQQGPPPIPKPKPPFLQDFLLGGVLFLLCIAIIGFAYRLTSGHGDMLFSFSMVITILCVVACFIGLLVTAIRSKRPGLIIVFSIFAAIAAAFGALYMLVMSICGGPI